MDDPVSIGLGWLKGRKENKERNKALDFSEQEYLGQKQMRDDITNQQRIGRTDVANIYGTALGQIDPSKMGLQKADQASLVYGGAGRAAQQSALARMQQAAAGGYSPEERAGMMQVRNDAGRMARGQREAAVSGLARRGMGNSGMAALAAAKAAGDAGDRMALTGAQQEANMFQRGLQANAQAANLGSTMANQDFTAKLNQLEALKYNNQISDKEYNERKNLTLARAGIDAEKSSANTDYNIGLQNNNIGASNQRIDTRNQRAGLKIDKLENDFGALLKGHKWIGDTGMAVAGLASGNPGMAMSAMGSGNPGLQQMQGGGQPSLQGVGGYTGSDVANIQGQQLSDRVYQDEQGNWRTRY